jgi:hypothetical protein
VRAFYFERAGRGRVAQAVFMGAVAAYGAWRIRKKK